ncbi:RNA-directed DNA polymerase, eukaryota, reverse transcriptase zinc-binding domain protein [Tanacetum coccineum]
MNGHMLPPPPSQLDTSYASIANGGKTSSYKANETEGMKSISLLDHDLIKIEDSSEVVLVKVKEVDTMINMYGVCRKEGFINLKIHYISGLWTWITFPNASACAAFKQNDSLKFAGFIRKFRYFQNNPTTPTQPFEFIDESTVGSGKLCISTKQSTKISETVHVIIDGETFAVYVQELASWNVKLDDDTEQEDSINAHVASDGLSANLEQPLDDMEPQKPLSDHIDDQFQEVASDGLFDTKTQSPAIAAHQVSNISNGNLLIKKIHRHVPTQVNVPPPLLGKFILFGDLNEVKEESERLRSTFNRSEARVFKSFIADSRLIDLPLRGHLYTWMNKDGSKLSKLDRFLISNQIIDDNPDMKAIILDRKCLHNKFKFFKARLKEWHQIQKQQESSRQQEHKKIQIIDNKIEHSLASDFEKEERVQLIQELILGPERALLEQNVSLDEIKQAVWDCGSTKASRPDEFSFLFLKTY